MIWGTADTRPNGAPATAPAALCRAAGRRSTRSTRASPPVTRPPLPSLRMRACSRPPRHAVSASGAPSLAQRVRGRLGAAPPCRRAPPLPAPARLDAACGAAPCYSPRVAGPAAPAPSHADLRMCWQTPGTMGSRAQATACACAAPRPGACQWWCPNTHGRHAASPLRVTAHSRSVQDHTPSPKGAWTSAGHAKRG